MQCVQALPDGTLQVLNPQPAIVTTCTLVVQSGAEVGASPFNLSAEDGAQIGGAIVMVWGVAFAWSAVIKALGVDDPDPVD